MTLELNTTAFEEKTDLAAIEELAKFVVLEEAKQKKLEAEAAELKAKIETAKSDLAEMLEAAGMESARLSCGLTPRRTLERKYFKAPGVGDDQVHDFLRRRWISKAELAAMIEPGEFETLEKYWPDTEYIPGLDAVGEFPRLAEAIRDASFSHEDIIKPYVHFQTLQSTLKEFEGLGGPIPEDLFKVSEVKSVKMFGKTNFLKSQESAS
jgi:hypothetical protein